MAHKILTIAYELMKSGKEYVDLGGDYFDRLNPGRTVRRLTARLERIGYQVTLSPLAPQADSLIALASAMQPELPQPAKRKRGRPRKYPVVEPATPSPSMT